MADVQWGEGQTWLGFGSTYDVVLYVILMVKRVGLCLTYARHSENYILNCISS